MVGSITIFKNVILEPNNLNSEETQARATYRRASREIHRAKYTCTLTGMQFFFFIQLYLYSSDFSWFSSIARHLFYDVTICVA